MNKLYRLIPTVWLNDKELNGYKLMSLQLRYGEIPLLSKVIEYKDFDTVWNENLFFCKKDITLFTGKRILIGAIDAFSTIKVSEKDFKSYKVRFNAEIYDDNSFSVHDLMEQLPAADFAKWCKDNGLQICPLK